MSFSCLFVDALVHGTFDLRNSFRVLETRVEEEVDKSVLIIAKVARSG